MAEADYGESDLMDNQHTLFLKDLSDQQVVTNTIMLEQVTNLVWHKMIKQLPQLVWDTLRMFEFGEGEEAIRVLHKHLKSANGRNAKFLERLRQEGVRREELAKLNDMGAVLTQVQPIGNSAILLAATIALVQTRGTSVYCANDIQLQLAEDLQKQFFMLRQPEEEAVWAGKKVFTTDVIFC